MDGPPRPLVIVVDTYVYISGTILSRGNPFKILDAWRRLAHILVTSELIIAEVERALRSPRIQDRYGVTGRDIARLLASPRTDALIVPGAQDVDGVSRDPDDDKVLACAMEAQADCIVTGDTDLLALGSHRGVEILSPREFLEPLEHR